MVPPSFLDTLSAWLGTGYNLWIAIAATALVLYSISRRVKQGKQGATYDSDPYSQPSYDANPYSQPDYGY